MYGHPEPPFGVVILPFGLLLDRAPDWMFWRVSAAREYWFWLTESAPEPEVRARA